MGLRVGEGVSEPEGSVGPAEVRRLRSTGSGGRGRLRVAVHYGSPTGGRAKGDDGAPGSIPSVTSRSRIPSLVTVLIRRSRRGGVGGPSPTWLGIPTLRPVGASKDGSGHYAPGVVSPTFTGNSTSSSMTMVSSIYILESVQ